MRLGENRVPEVLIWWVMLCFGRCTDRLGLSQVWEIWENCFKFIGRWTDGWGECAWDMIPWMWSWVVATVYKVCMVHVNKEVRMEEKILHWWLNNLLVSPTICECCHQMSPSLPTRFKQPDQLLVEVGIPGQVPSHLFFVSDRACGLCFFIDTFEHGEHSPTISSEWDWSLMELTTPCRHCRGGAAGTALVV